MLKEDPYDLLTYSELDEIDIIQSVFRDYQPDTVAVKGGYLTSLAYPPEFITNYEKASIIFNIRQLGMHTVSRIKYDETARQVYIYLG